MRPSRAPAASMPRACGEQAAQDGSAVPAVWVHVLSSPRCCRRVIREPVQTVPRACGGQAAQDGSAVPAVWVHVLSSPRCCRRVIREPVQTVPRRRADIYALYQRAGHCVQTQSARLSLLYYSIGKRKIGGLKREIQKEFTKNAGILVYTARNRRS